MRDSSACFFLNTRLYVFVLRLTGKQFTERQTKKPYKTKKTDRKKKKKKKKKEEEDKKRTKDQRACLRGKQQISALGSFKKINIRKRKEKGGIVREQNEGKKKIKEK